MDAEALGSSTLTMPISPTYASPTGCDPMEEYLPKVIPQCTTLTITRQSILRLAIARLGVKLHEIRVTPMNSTDLLGSVSMDVPPHRQYPYTSRQEFFGDYTPWKDEAIESACSTALDYLKRVGILIVDDANYAELRICQTELQKARFWEDAFRDRAASLQKALGESVPTCYHNTISDHGDPDQQNDAETGIVPTPLSEHTSTSHSKQGMLPDDILRYTDEDMSGSDATGQVDIGWASASSRRYVLPPKATPPSSRRLPNLGNTDVPLTSATRRALFLQPDCAADGVDGTPDPTENADRREVSSLIDEKSCLMMKKCTT